MIGFFTGTFQIVITLKYLIFILDLRKRVVLAREMGWAAVCQMTVTNDVQVTNRKPVFSENTALSYS
jgi:hypothetical protein